MSASDTPGSPLSGTIFQVGDLLNNTYRIEAILGRGGTSEVYRAGIDGVPKGQWEACRALSLSPRRTWQAVILPQAVRRMLPALTNRGIEIFKMTTLASAVAYVELLQQGKLLASLNFNPIETYTVIAVVFFLCLFPLVQMTYALERRLGRSDA